MATEPSSLTKSELINLAQHHSIELKSWFTKSKMIAVLAEHGINTLDDLLTHPESSHTSQGEILQFLTSKAPRTNTLIEFKEVFEATLDSTYKTFYLTLPELLPDTHKTIPAENLSDVRILDYRPMRWYRDLKQIRDSIQQARKILKARQNQLQLYDTPLELDYSEHDARPALDDWEKEIYGIQNRIKEIQNEIQELEQADWNIQQEIAFSSHSLIQDNVPDYYTERGYDFFILGGHRSFSDYKPTPVPENIDFSDEEAFANFAAEFRIKLKTNTNIKDHQLELFDQQIENLHNTKELLEQLISNPLKEEIEQLKSELQSLGPEPARPQLQTSKDEIVIYKPRPPSKHQLLYNEILQKS